MNSTMKAFEALLKERQERLVNLKEEKQESQENLYKQVDEFFIKLEEEFKNFLYLLPNIKEITKYKNSFITEIPETDFIVVMFDSKLSSERKGIKYKDDKNELSMSFYKKNFVGNSKGMYNGIRMRGYGEHYIENFGKYQEKFYGKEIRDYKYMEKEDFELILEISKNMRKIKKGLEKEISSIGLDEIEKLETEAIFEKERFEKLKLNLA